MNKGDLINKVAESAGISKADASTAVNTVFSSIQETLKSGDKAAFVGFGTFSANMRPERQGRNPRTGESITIAAKNTVKFKVGKEFSEYIN